MQAPSPLAVPQHSQRKCCCRPHPHIDGPVLLLGPTYSFLKRPGVISQSTCLLPFCSRRFTYSLTWHPLLVSVHTVQYYWFPFDTAVYYIWPIYETFYTSKDYPKIFFLSIIFLFLFQHVHPQCLWRSVQMV